ncbi:MAG: GIY-YIG nuclease family protein [Acidaminococcaceae bacterium]|nr:GIY-YIG nuclease family protein [Acidaminococcaceae bacterium]
MEREYCVYMHRFPNGKVYIGITNREPEKRWNGGRGYKSNHGLFSAILKYGWINIEHIVLATGLTEEQASAEEKRLVCEYQSDDIKHGYNLQTGGIEGFTHNEEARKKISEAAKRMWSDPEKRQKLCEIQKAVQAKPEIVKRKSEWSKNRYHNDDEYRENLLTAIRNRMSDPKVKKQYSEMSKKMWATPGHREKMHEKLSGPDSPFAKPVDQFTKDGKFVKRYPSCKIAAEETGTNRSGVTACAKGKQETSGGYVWRYAE